MSARLPTLITALALAAATAGCGGDEGGGGSNGGAAKPKPVNEGSAAVNVDMRDIKYVPQRVTVKRGGTITWTNSDAIAHTVTKTKGPGPEFDSGTINEGKTYRRSFPTPGTIDYVCTLHPNQTGSIVVK